MLTYPFSKTENIPKGFVIKLPLQNIDVVEVSVLWRCYYNQNIAKTLCWVII